MSTIGPISCQQGTELGDTVVCYATLTADNTLINLYEEYGEALTAPGAKVAFVTLQVTDIEIIAED